MPKLVGDDRPALLYPAPLALTPSWDLFHETTARLLFMVVRWVRGLAPYQTLSARDQVGAEGVSSGRRVRETLVRCGVYR